MKNYNDEYYIAFRPSGDNQTYINPDLNTAKKTISFQATGLWRKAFVLFERL
ncbi:hypothetical protein [Shewanella algae]|uniref:hypothetical protein n=1 Tax=Shewanella algae TaxID=38313 RepID=UPI001BED957F|nr:hypothetical protein [Shewanella algae]BCV61614.1 hypothetical protein TUM17386_12850 [Shewanella algae]